jgi:hypothetical protein
MYADIHARRDILAGFRLTLPQYGCACLCSGRYAHHDFMVRPGRVELMVSLIAMSTFASV